MSNFGGPPGAVVAAAPGHRAIIATSDDISVHLYTLTKTFSGGKISIQALLLLILRRMIPDYRRKIIIETKLRNSKIVEAKQFQPGRQ